MQNWIPDFLLFWKDFMMLMRSFSKIWQVNIVVELNLTVYIVHMNAGVPSNAPTAKSSSKKALVASANDIPELLEAAENLENENQVAFE